MPIDVAMPDYLGARALTVALSGDTPRPTQGEPFIVDFGYEDASTQGAGQPAPEGVVLPLILQLIAPSGRIVFERVFEDVEPDSADMIADEGGLHLVRIVERYHNRWFGSLVVDVEGDRSPREVA